MRHSASTVRLSALGIAAAALFAFTGAAHAQTFSQSNTVTNQTNTSSGQKPCEGRVGIVHMASLLPWMLPDYHIVITEAPGHYNLMVMWSEPRIRNASITDFGYALAGRTGALCPNGIMARFSPTVPSTYGQFNVPANGTVVTDNLFGSDTLIGGTAPRR